MTTPRRPTPRHHRRLPRWLKRGLRSLAKLGRWWAGAPTVAGWTTYAPPFDDQLLSTPDERRCGWFDSSQDLREGLCISEHAGDDAVCAQLPVMAWVQLQLSGWKPSLASPHG